MVDSEPIFKRGNKSLPIKRLHGAKYVTKKNRVYVRIG